MLGGRAPQVNGQDHIVQSGNYCYLSLRVVTTDKIKIQSSKDYHDTHSNHMSKPHYPSCGSKKWARSAEVGALTPVLEKSSTKLLHKQSAIQIAIFNVRSLNRIVQQLELTVVCGRHSIAYKNTDTIRLKWK